ncbi:hypothetical protein WDW37_18750 [Bdellovibrionota bacterium FG-1]
MKRILMSAILAMAVSLVIAGCTTTDPKKKKDSGHEQDRSDWSFPHGGRLWM